MYSGVTVLKFWRLRIALLDLTKYVLSTLFSVKYPFSKMLCFCGTLEDGLHPETK
jgi:hypothetical protein